MRLRVLLILAMAATLLAVPAATAQADVNPKYVNDGFYDVGLTGVSDLLVDQTAGEVLISDGTNLTVTGLSGNVTSTKTGLAARLDQMVMSDDGSQVFALERHTSNVAGGTVSRIDASALTVTASSSPVALGATSIAYSAGLLWVLDAPATAGSNSTLVAVDPTSLTVVNTFDAGAVVDQIVSGPGVPGELYAWLSNSQLVKALYRIDVTGPTTPAVTLGTSTHFTNAVTAVGVAPDGSAVWASADYVRALDPTTLSTSSTLDYASPSDVQVRANDDVVAFNPGSGDPMFYFPGTNSYGSAPAYLTGFKAVGGTLGFGATQLYWVAQGTLSGTTGTSYRLGITTPAHDSAVGIKVHKNDNWRYNASVTVTASLTRIPAVDLAGQTVEVYGQTLGGAPVLLGSGPVDATGVFTMSFHVKEYTDLTALYPGDDTYSPAVSTTIWVKCHAKLKGKAIRTKRHEGKYALYKYSKPAIAKVHVSPNHTGSKLFFYWQYYLNGWHTAGTTQHVLLNSKSNGYYLLNGDKSVIGVKFRIIAWFKGDNRNDEIRSKPVYFRFTY